MICDFAEVYHIFDYRALSVVLVAKLAYGLRRDARVWRTLNGSNDFDLELKVATYDCLRLLIWLNSSDGQEGVNRPSSLYEKLFGEEKPDEAQRFATPEDFQAKWEEINGNNS